MATRIAIIDIDGVIANNEARFAKAEEAKSAYYDANRQPGASAAVLDKFIPALERGATDIYWRTAFTPDLVALDTLIDGVQEALEQIERSGYDILFLTSRPESMRQATVDWLWSFSPDFVVLDGEGAYRDQLIMKPASAQFVKTVVWKSLTVEMLVRLFGCDELLFIDDEPAIYESVAALALPCKCKVTASLQHALAMLEETV